MTPPFQTQLRPGTEQTLFVQQLLIAKIPESPRPVTNSLTIVIVTTNLGISATFRIRRCGQEQPSASHEDQDRHPIKHCITHEL